MKKFVKFTLITAAILTVTGLGFVIAGVMTAGGAGTLKAGLKSGNLNFGNWHFEDGVYYNGDMQLDVTGMVQNAMNFLPAGNEKSSHEFTADIKTLEVHTDLSNITVKTSDVESVRVTLEKGYVKYYKAEEKDNSLYISYDTSGHALKQGPEITVEVPRQTVLEEIYVNTSLGEITLKELEHSIQKLEICSDMGSILVKDCEVTGYGRIEASLGNINIEDSYFKTAELEADMGNIEFSGELAGDLTAQADMGNIEAVLKGMEEDYNIDLNADMGKVTCNHKKYNNAHHGTDHSSVTYYNEHAIGDIILNCDMGNVKLIFE